MISSREGDVNPGCSVPRLYFIRFGIGARCPFSDASGVPRVIVDVRDCGIYARWSFRSFYALQWCPRGFVKEGESVVRVSSVRVQMGLPGRSKGRR